MTSQPTTRESRHTSPVIVLLGILLLATALTWLVESGAYQREGRLVLPDSYQTLEKDRSLSHLWDTSRERVSGMATPVGLIDTLMAIPEGLERMAGLIFMVLMIGGMFGILTHSGAVDAGLERLLSGIRGNVYVLVPVLMLVFSAGSTFLGLASEYLLIIPLMVAMANRLGLSSVTGLAIVTVAVKAGYLSSVSNPIPLSIAQPLVGVQVFSGAGFRFACYLVFLAASILYVLFMIRREGHDHGIAREFDHAPLSARHRVILALIGAGVAFLVYGSNRWHWSHEELSAYYIGLSVVIAAAAGIGPSEAADAFVRGMKKILMATMLIGVASAVAITLEHGQVLDSIVHGLTGLIGEDGAWVAAVGMFFSQLLLDFLIPSTSGQAAVSMPILGPLGQLTGVSPQTTVLAFLFGNGITNLLTPTSGTLLAYLAAAQVGWVQWARYTFWLWIIYIGIAIVMLTVALRTGF
jgi:uncharacterized ion transporter superfamily protein YfcC